MVVVVGVSSYPANGDGRATAKCGCKMNEDRPTSVGVRFAIGKCADAVDDECGMDDNVVWLWLSV